MKRPTRSSLLLVLLLAAGCAATRPAPTVIPAPAASAERLAATLPLDPALTVGRLDNGLRYVIRENRRPEQRAEVWLVVDAGSILEDEDQRGLAHFIEHMAFNGTENFARQELVAYLESIGMRFGPDINAWTGFDETVYTLRVPTDEPAILEKAFDILEDWAHGVTFEPAEVDKERGVIVEEWRLGRGAGARMRDQQFPVLLEGSRYAERLPIGAREVIEKASPEVLKRFYQDWYRPDLMAVIAVGDFEAARVEALVKEHFSALAGPDRPRERLVYEVPEHKEPLFAITTDPEATATTIGVYTKHDKRPEDTVGDYRRFIVESLYHGMLSGRLTELTRTDDPPFSWAASSSGTFVRSTDVTFQVAGAHENEVPRGLDALLTEIERVKRHGFTSTELERAKSELVRFYEQAAGELGKLESDTFATEYVRHLMEGEPTPGIVYELGLVRELLPGIGLAELQRLAREWTADRNRVILVSAPEKSASPPPTQEQLAAVFNEVARREVTPWVDRVREGPLVTEVPRPASIVEETAIPELGVTEWRLSNGVRVVLKPTDFQNDEIFLTGTSPGGSSLVPDEQYLSALVAPTLLRRAGVGRFDQITLEKALAGKVADVQSHIGELEEGVRGVASSRDLETMFQLLYLTLTSPRKDAELFNTFLGGLQVFLTNRQAEPEAVFEDKLTDALFQGHERRRPLALSDLRRIDLETAYGIYKDRFGDVSDFTFIVVGNFEVETIRPLVLTWLGGLPANGRIETWRDVGVQTPPGVVEVEVERGLEPKSQVDIVFTGEGDASREGRNDIDALADLLEIRLREVLREDMGAVYGVGVSGELVSRPRERYTFSIQFGCAPERVDSLVAAVFAEIESVKANGVPEVYVQRVREAKRRSRELALKENRFWLEALEFHYEEGLDPRAIVRDADLLERVTAERLQAAAREYLDEERYVLGVLRPEAVGERTGR